MALLDKVKVACRVTTTAYDDELTDLIHAALADMNITDINAWLLDKCQSELQPLVQRAVITYCKMNFGFSALTEALYDRLKASYDEQKAQMLMNSEYTTWS